MGLRKTKVKGESVLLFTPDKRRKEEPERELMIRVKTALAAIGVLVFRNSVGVARHGPRTFPYGLCRGSADLVGLVRTKAGVARFFALELKTKSGRVSRDQERWIKMINFHGGYAAVVRSVEDALAAVEACKQGVML